MPLPPQSQCFTLVIRLLEMNSSATCVLPVAVARVQAIAGTHAFQLMALREEADGEPAVFGEGHLSIAIPQSLLRLDGSTCLGGFGRLARIVPLAYMTPLKQMVAQFGVLSGRCIISS
jgi:hypothetical protein